MWCAVQAGASMHLGQEVQVSYRAHVRAAARAPFLVVTWYTLRLALSSSGRPHIAFSTVQLPTCRITSRSIPLHKVPQIALPRAALIGARHTLLSTACQHTQHQGSTWVASRNCGSLAVEPLALAMVRMR